MRGSEVEKVHAGVDPRMDIPRGVGDGVGVVDADGWWDGGRKEGSNYLGSFP